MQTRKSQVWTVKQLSGFSQELARAYGVEVVSSASSNSSDTWTADKFINFGQAMSSAYLP